jgi:hypothetical protein
MEFEHIGVHCAACKTKDFLPTTCDRCNRIYCNHCIHDDDMHRNLCSKADMTSFECPVCGKVIKLDMIYSVTVLLLVTIVFVSILISLMYIIL